MKKQPYTTITTEQTQDAIQNSVPLIDVRRADEWQSIGIIKGSHKITFFDEVGDYDIDGWLKEFTKIVKTKDEPFVLVCAHANRTKTIGRFLGLELGYTNVQELDGGINYGWIDKGLPVEK